MAERVPAAIPQLSVRWSEQEACKPYARPLGVSFADLSGEPIGGIAVSGADLLYYRQFQAAVLALAGELFIDPRAETAPDPQRAWLDVLAELLPPVDGVEVAPASVFDQTAGRVFSFRLGTPDLHLAIIPAPVLLGYQDFQAAVAHQSGRLYRNATVEAVDDPGRRQSAWIVELRAMMKAPPPAEAMAEAWPWRG